MTCPKCNGSLAADDAAEVPHAQCDKCSAVWLQRSALEAMLRREAKQRGVELAKIVLLEGAPRPSDLACPTGDGQILDVVTLRGVPVESCAGCGGLLLDQGESGVIADRTALASKEWSPAYDEMMRLVAARNTAEVNRIRTII